MYLMVDGEDKKLTITYQKTEAEAFSIMTVNDRLNHHELEFSLTSNLYQFKKKRQSKDKESTTLEDKVVGLQYMLEVDVNRITGRGQSAPKMKLCSSHRRTRLLLKKRSDRRISSDTKDWIKGTEAYYIECMNAIGTGFLCVNDRTSFRRGELRKNGTIPALGDEDSIKGRLKVCVVGSSSAKMENRYFMLFTLQPQQPPKNTQQAKIRVQQPQQPPRGGLDQTVEQYPPDISQQPSSVQPPQQPPREQATMMAYPPMPVEQQQSDSQQENESVDVV